MPGSIRRLGAGDESILDLLAERDPDFDVDGRGVPRKRLEPAAAERYLANPAVLFWIATDDEDIIGFLSCLLLPLRSDDGQELLLYEIGVLHTRRRHGVGRALLEHMDGWMRANGIAEVWVCADNPAAVDFYRGCGFTAGEQPTYMTRRLDATADQGDTKCDS